MGALRILARRAVVVAMGAGGLIPVLAPPGWACSCVPGGARVSAPRADVVFTGVLREVGGDHLDLEADFAVEWVYRGDVGDELIVVTPGQGSSCGYGRWAVGERYTIVANELDGRLSTNGCLGILRGAIDPDVYGLPAGSPRDPPPAGYSWWVYPGGVALGVLGGLLIVRRLRRRRS